MTFLLSSLRTGELFPFHLLGIQGFCMRLSRIVMIGKSPVLVLAFTGRILMKISASKAYFVERQLLECV